MFKRIFWYTLGVITALVALFFLMGAMASPTYVGSKSVVVDAKVEDVWNVISNAQRISGGEYNLSSIKTAVGERLPLADVNEEFAADSASSPSMVEVVNEKPLELMEVRIHENRFGITGTWKYELQEQGSQTQLTVTENSVTAGLFTRSLLSVLGRDSNIDWHLKAIKQSAETL